MRDESFDPPSPLAMAWQARAVDPSAHCRAGRISGIDRIRGERDTRFAMRDEMRVLQKGADRRRAASYVGQEGAKANLLSPYVAQRLLAFFWKRVSSEEEL